jgi:hypothetical protein
MKNDVDEKTENKKKRQGRAIESRVYVTPSPKL